MQFEQIQNPLTFQRISLDLFGKGVIVVLNPYSNSYIKHGPHVEGKIIGRIWGQRLIGDVERLETVVAISIATDIGEKIIINWHDIENLKQADTSLFAFMSNNYASCRSLFL